MPRMTKKDLDSRRFTHWLDPQEISWYYQEEGVPGIEQTSQYGRVTNIVWLLLEQERMHDKTIMLEEEGMVALANLSMEIRFGARGSTIQERGA